MWRSLLFVPILDDRLVQSAARSDADIVTLDLEAAVPADRKDEARARLNACIKALHHAGAKVAVRINQLTEGGDKDIDSARRARADVIVLPKATSETTAQTAEQVGPETPLVPLIEDPSGVIETREIAAAAASVIAVGFGVEDYAQEMGAPPSIELLTPAAFQVIQAARAANCSALVLPDTIADYRDLARFEHAAWRARALGASGSFAIHPGQVEVLNRVFSPSEGELEQARRIVEAAEAARRKGLAVAKLDGLMIDAPIEARAKALLVQQENHSQ